MLKPLAFIPGVGMLLVLGGKESDVMRANPHLTLVSDTFHHGGEIPPVYTCEGQEISPRLTWSNVPSGVKSFALLVEDPDSPGGTFSHWVMYNIPADKREIPPSIPPTSSLPDGTSQGINDFRKIGYRGPCPPHGTRHRYYFRIFALKTMLSRTGTMNRAALLRAIEEQVIAKGELMGFFSRK